LKMNAFVNFQKILSSAYSSLMSNPLKIICTFLSAIEIDCLLLIWQ
jgi:hypothetical protein